MDDVQIAILTPEDKEKITKHLELIKLISEKGRELGYRIIIHGGYATDAALGKITRPHNDIDIQVYGKGDNPQKALEELLSELGDSWEFEDRGRKEYYHNFLVRSPGIALDMYYLQVASNPLLKEKNIVKSNGTISQQEFQGLTGELNGITFEIQDPLIEITDKILKRERGEPKLSKHEQDIENLRTVVSEEEIQEKLILMKK